MILFPSPLLVLQVPPPIPPLVAGTAVVAGPLVVGYAVGKVVKALTPEDASPTSKVLAGAAAGAALGVALGSAIPGLGNVAGGIIGGLLGGFGAWLS